jgi:hypothetical protein
MLSHADIVAWFGACDLPDGVYPHLPDANYFAQDRLGSTDFVKLHKAPADWWYGSRHNPDHKREPTDEMQFGSALHALLLEGEEAYERVVAVKPDYYPETDKKTGAVTLKPWHGSANYCKAWAAENADRPLHLTAVQDRAVRHMVALVLAHPQLGPVMRAGMPEVAILWTDPATGLRLRAKIDYLLPRFCIDLKSFGGDAKGLTLNQQVNALVAQRDMDVQRRMYFSARQAMAELIKAGALFGASPEEADWLTRVAAIDDWQWCWIFYRRREDGRGYAPMVKPVLRSHMRNGQFAPDITFTTGEEKLRIAKANYLTFRERYGLDVPWAVIEPAEEPDDAEFPAWIKNTQAPFQFAETTEA